MKRQSTLLIAVLAACAIFATACSKTTTNTNNANTSTNTSSKATNTTTTSSTQASGSPTAVTQASFDAFKKKDVAGFKKTISSADLKSLEEVMATAKDGKNVDDFLKELMESPDSSMPDTFETRNEKIDGDKATVQYKDKDGGWKTMYLVKEGSEWKMKMGGEDENPPAKKESGGMDDTGHK
ncbi:MAG TPA: hypothetical protein VGO69_11805 [Pyrinomonadaceae bacterium]|jgi:hypothetical protein|nr:hypothetical protein [Pyrinomonadaceae bacterium]